MRVLVTGADGFLGWHLRVLLRATTDHDVVGIGRREWATLGDLVPSVDAVVHVAGANRGPDDEVEATNVELAEDLAAAVRRSTAPVAVVYANSAQAGNGSAYGNGKLRASQILRSAVEGVGGPYTDVVLPNLFGEHGRPGYNSFVATFAHGVVDGADLQVTDRAVDLLHVQQAAQVLVDALTGPGGTVAPRGLATSVVEVLERLRTHWSVYSVGEIPPLPDQLSIDLFNTVRAVAFARRPAIALTRRADERGALVETVRAHGSEGQTFFSSTVPGVTRGQHFHLRKFERFVVVGGSARISLRRVLTDTVVDVDVSGEDPVAIDMPTGWAHKITNTADSALTTMFWTNELFDPDDTDTYPETV